MGQSSSLQVKQVSESESVENFWMPAIPAAEGMSASGVKRRLGDIRCLILKLTTSQPEPT